MSATGANGFIKLEKELLRSEVFAHLSGNATRLLVFIWAEYNGYNNGLIAFGIEQMKACLNCSQPTATKASQELRDAGLIEAVEEGSSRSKNGCREDVVTIWRLTFIS